MDTSHTGSAQYTRGNSFDMSVSGHATWGSVVSDTAYLEAEPSYLNGYAIPMDHPQSDAGHQTMGADPNALFRPGYPAHNDQPRIEIQEVPCSGAQTSEDMVQMGYPQWPLPASSQVNYDSLPRYPLTEDAVAQVDTSYSTDQYGRPISPTTERYRRTSEAHEQLALGRTPRASSPERLRQQLNQLRRTLRKAKVKTSSSH